MIADGQRVLIGSHNWSKDGMTLNRDASLLFEDFEIADYYRQSFEIDWIRAGPVRIRRARPEGAARIAITETPPAGFRRMLIDDFIED